MLDIMQHTGFDNSDAAAMLCKHPHNAAVLSAIYASGDIAYACSHHGALERCGQLGWAACSSCAKCSPSAEHAGSPYINSSTIFAIPARYVCVSGIHLGEQLRDSVLDPDEVICSPDVPQVLICSAEHATVSASA